MKNPDISVIVPIYNVGRYLDTCLDSILSSSFENYEVICVNDGSTDDSLEILEHYAKSDSRIIVIDKENGGVSSARNVALSHAKGKYIMCVDPDDYISSIAMEKLYNFAEEKDVDLIVFDYMNDIFENGSKGLSTGMLYWGGNHQIFNADTISADGYNYLPVMCWLKFYKREIIPPNPFPENMIFEDVVFWGKIFNTAKSIMYLPLPLYFYVMRRETSYISEAGKNFLGITKAYDMLKQIFKDAGRYDKFIDVINLIMITEMRTKLELVHDDYAEEYYYLIKNYLKQHQEDIDMFIKDSHKKFYDDKFIYMLESVKQMQEMDFETYYNTYIRERKRRCF